MFPQLCPHMVDLRVSEISTGNVVFGLSHFRGWQISVEALLDCVVYRVECTPSPLSLFTQGMGRGGVGR
jgi:hypothetical protein